MIIKLIIPSTWNLLQLISCLLLTIYMGRKCWIFKTMNLIYVDIFIKTTVKELVVDVKLSKWPIVLDYNWEHDLNGGGLYDGVEHRVEINTKLLSKVLCHFQSFVIINSSIGFSYDLEQPSTSNNILSGHIWFLSGALNSTFIEALHLRCLLVGWKVCSVTWVQVGLCNKKIS